jgi:hypothetical protein
MSKDHLRRGNEDQLRAGGPTTEQKLRFEDCALDGAGIREKNLHLSQFGDCGFKNAAFEDCAFNHSRFERCYFRKATFNRVSFIGCTFHDCRFDEAQFTDCQFDYAEFFNCQITYRQLVHTLPPTDNVVRALARNLRVNSEGRGQTEDYREFLMREIRATENHNFRKAFDWNDAFYRNKYKPADRLAGLATWLGLRFNGVFWGHGEVPFRVFISAALVVVFFAWIYARVADQFSQFSAATSFLDCVGLSAAAFITTTYGSVIARTVLARGLVTIEGVVGLTMFGFLVAALYRRISRR